MRNFCFYTDTSARSVTFCNSASSQSRHEHSTFLQHFATFLQNVAKYLATFCNSVPGSQSVASLLTSTRSRSQGFLPSQDRQMGENDPACPSLDHSCQAYASLDHNSCETYVFIFARTTLFRDDHHNMIDSCGSSITQPSTVIQFDFDCMTSPDIYIPTQGRILD